MTGIIPMQFTKTTTAVDTEQY